MSKTSVDDFDANLTENSKSPEIYKGSPSKKVVVLDDRPLPPLTIDFRPAFDKILQHRNAEIGVSESVGSSAADSDSQELLNSDREIDADQGKRPSASYSENPPYPVILRRRRRARLLRQFSGSDGERSTVKELTKAKAKAKDKKLLGKKYANIAAKIDTGTKNVSKTLSVQLTKTEQCSSGDSKNIEFVSAYTMDTAKPTQQNTNKPEEPGKAPTTPPTMELQPDVQINPGKAAQIMAQIIPTASTSKVQEVEQGTAMDTNSPPEVSTNSSTYKVPRKTSKLTSLKIQDSPQIVTKNQFSPLTTIAAEREIAEKAIQSTRRSPTQPNRPARNSNPPPLVLAGIPDTHRNFIAEIKPYIKKHFTVKYTTTNSIVYTTDKSDYLALKTALTDVMLHQFHTYTPKEQKQHAFVLVGLQGNPGTDEIKTELEEEYNLQVANVYKMKTKKIPLFLVIMPNTITIKQLQQEVKVISYTRIRWERRRNERMITQCRRCQAWGHATSNCYRTPRCVKCSGNHFARDCALAVNEEPTCANCKGNHTASSVDCPIYKSKVEAIQKSQEKQQTHNQPKQYKEAPLPTSNPWNKAKQGTSANGDQREAAQPQQNVAEATGTRSRATTSAGASVPTSAGVINGATAMTSTTTSDFSLLINELTKLNTIIDIKQTIKAVSALNNMMAGATNALQAIELMQQYIQFELPKYNILRSTP